MAKTKWSPELLSETLVELSKARKQIPGRGVSPSCFERWVQKGINGARLVLCSNVKPVFQGFWKSVKV